MGAFATITLPLDLSRGEAAGAIALKTVERFPGTRNVTLDTATSAVTFDLHFPGSLTGLRQRLDRRGVGVGELATISIPVVSLAPAAENVDPAHRLTEGSEVWDPQFVRAAYVTTAQLEGGRVDATIEPSTEAMHQLYDGMLSLSLVAAEPATVILE